MDRMMANRTPSEALEAMSKDTPRRVLDALEGVEIGDGSAGVRAHMGGERVKALPACTFCGGSGVDGMSEDECLMCDGSGMRREGPRGLNDDSWGFSEAGSESKEGL